MSSDSRTATAAKTGRRSIGGLVNSSGKMALVGVLASVATLGFTLGLQHLLIRQKKVGEPLMRASLDLKHLLNQTFVELRGWVAYGDLEAKAQRNRIWEEDIQNNLDMLRSAAKRLDAQDVIADAEALEDKLRQLRYLQWHVEDIAHTPNNYPAGAAYNTELEPISEEILLFLDTASGLAHEGPDVSKDAHLLKAKFLELDRQLISYLESGSGSTVGLIKKLAQELTEGSGKLRSKYRGRERYHPVEALMAAASDCEAFATRVPYIISLRASKQWNYSAFLYQTQLKPLKQAAGEIAEGITEKQYLYLKNQSKGLLHWSFVVLALALVMGGLSVASLVVNYRLEHRVQNMLAKAKSLGQYIIEERLGGGGMGDVYKANHALLRRPSAVKVLRIESALDPDAQQRFRKEVQLTSQLTHPNTIAIFDYGKTPEGLFYYAMELLNGVTLDRLVAVAGPLPASRVIHILKQVCGSLNEAHQKGLLHRDIKPSNIMVAELGGIWDQVKVLDFGLVAQMTGPQPQGNGQQKLVGTPAYLAPETIETEVNASPRSDIYAIGAVGYYLLTGTSLFPHQKVSEILSAHLNTLPEPPSVRLGAQLNEKLELLVLGCLAKSPEDRPRDVQSLRGMLEQVSVDTWSDEDAAHWWDQFGEAVQAEAEAQNRQATLSRSRIGAGRGLDISGSSPS